jgi:hypothetical protein
MDGARGSTDYPRGALYSLRFLLVLKESCEMKNVG